jgi:hypothetical protein
VSSSCRFCGLCGVRLMHVRILPMTAIEFLCCFRPEILKEVFPDARGPLGSVKLVEEANYFVFKKIRKRNIAFGHITACGRCAC